mgnify:CR=1 FL=1
MAKPTAPTITGADKTADYDAMSKALGASMGIPEDAQGAAVTAKPDPVSPDLSTAGVPQKSVGPTLAPVAAPKPKPVKADVSFKFDDVTKMEPHSMWVEGGELKANYQITPEDYQAALEQVPELNKPVVAPIASKPAAPPVSRLGMGFSADADEGEAAPLSELSIKGTEERTKLPEVGFFDRLVLADNEKMEQAQAAQMPSLQDVKTKAYFDAKLKAEGKPTEKVEDDSWIASNIKESDRKAGDIKQRVTVYDQMKADIEDEREAVTRQLKKDAGDIFVPMVEMSSKGGAYYGVDTNTLRRSLREHHKNQQALDNYGEPWSNVDEGFRKHGVDTPEAIKARREAMEAEADDYASRKIKTAFAGKRHIVAVSIDDDKLTKELSQPTRGEQVDKVIREKTGGVMNLPAATVAGSGLFRDVAAIAAPKKFTVSVAGDEPAQSLTTGEIRGEEWGDWIPRVIFDTGNAILSTRLLTARKEGMAKIGPKLQDGDVKEAWEEYLKGSAAFNGVERTQEEREEYTRLIRSNPAMRDILQKDFAAGASELVNNGVVQVTPETREKIETVAGVAGYGTGMVTGDFVMLDPATVVLGGSSAIVSEGFKLMKLRQADILVETAIRIVNTADTNPDLAYKALAKINPAVADVVQSAVRVATRGEADSAVAVRVLAKRAEVLEKEAEEASKIAREAAAAVDPAKRTATEAAEVARVEATKGVTKAADEATLTATAAAKEQKDAHLAAIAEEAARKAEAKTAEAALTKAQADILAAQKAVDDAELALKEHLDTDAGARAALAKYHARQPKIEAAYDATSKEAAAYYAANSDVLDEVAKLVVEQDKAAEAYKLAEKGGEQALADLQYANAMMTKATTKAQKAGAVTAVQAAYARTAEAPKALEAAKLAMKKAAEPMKKLTPEAKTAWKKLMSLQDRMYRLAEEESALRGPFKDLDLPSDIAAADKLLVDKLKKSVVDAKAAYATVAKEVGGAEKASKLAISAQEKAAKLVAARRAARVSHMVGAGAKIEAAKSAKAAAGSRKVIAEVGKGEEAVEGAIGKAGKTLQRSEDVAATAKLTAEQSIAWRKAIVDTVTRYRTGLRAAPRLQEQLRAAEESKKLITDGLLLNDLGDTDTFFVRNTDMLKRIADRVGPKGLKWLAEQQTELGKIVRKLIESTETLSKLTPKEVMELQQGAKEYGSATLMGHEKLPELLTFNTVKALEAIEHTKAQGGIIAWAKAAPARIKRSFELGSIQHGSVTDQIPAIARAGSNKTTQLHDEAAYIAHHGEWKHVSEYGRAGLAKLGIDAQADAEGAIHAGLFLDYLGTTKPVIYGVGGTLLNTSTLSGESLFWQFRRQALTDGRLTEFMAKAAQSESMEGLEALAKEYADTAAPHLVGASRAWFPSTAENINPRTANNIMVWMMGELKRGEEVGEDVVDFIAAMRQRVEAAPLIGTTVVREGEEVASLLRSPRDAGLGRSDTDIVRVMGFYTALMGQGSNLFELNALLTKSMGGVIDAETIRHVDAFIGGSFAGVDGKPIDLVKVMDFFNRMGLPMTTDKTIIKEWGGKIGERTAGLLKLSSDPTTPVWTTRQLVDALDADLGKVVKGLEGRTRYDQVPGGSVATAMVNVWRRSVTVGLIAPRPTFWLTNWLGNSTQAWTVLGPSKGAQVLVNDIAPNIPLFGKWTQDYLSRASEKFKGKPVVGPVMEWLFNPHVSAVARGDKGFFKLKNGAIVDYDMVRRKMIEHGVVDTMLRTELTNVFARRRPKTLFGKIGQEAALTFVGEARHQRAMSDFQTMTQQRSRMSLYLRLLDDGHGFEKAGTLLNEALFDWKHGAPAIGAFMNMLPFWRFFYLGNRQAFRAMFQGVYDSRGALKAALTGSSELGHLRQQRAVWKGIEKAFTPDQMGPYATEEDQELAAMANLSPIWYREKMQVGLSRVDDEARLQMMLDSGQDKPYQVYGISAPTTLGIAGAQMSLMAASTAELYAGSLVGYGETVEDIGGDARGEAVGHYVDATYPFLSPAIHAALSKIGLDDESGEHGPDSWTSPEKAIVLRGLAKLTQQNPDSFAWQPKDGNGRWRMSYTAGMLAELPAMNEIIPWYARTALNPYRLSDDKTAVAAVTFGMTKALGLGPNYFKPTSRTDDLIYTAQEKLKTAEGKGIAEQQFGGFTEMPKKVDSAEPAR